MTLSACGSDGSSGKGEGEDKIAGADTSSKLSASPSETVPDQGVRPEIALPADVTYKFECGKSGDPAKDAVLHDAAG
ncbi:immunoglobulin domain-containing family protein [Streptomyces tendae]|uniref:hypothetical protein n=1 Tax=Streptomyces tendae TaxID=1932 RepID=UPI00368743B3